MRIARQLSAHDTTMFVWNEKQISKARRAKVNRQHNLGGWLYSDWFGLFIALGNKRATTV